MKSQNAEILEYLKQGNAITPSYAVNRFRCYRLGARIYDLRQAGYPIVTDKVKRKSKRSGRIVTFAAYSLAEAK